MLLKGVHQVKFFWNSRLAKGHPVRIAHTNSMTITRQKAPIKYNICFRIIKIPNADFSRQQKSFKLNHWRNIIFPFLFASIGVGHTMLNLAHYCLENQFLKFCFFFSSGVEHWKMCFKLISVQSWAKLKKIILIALERSIRKYVWSEVIWGAEYRKQKFYLTRHVTKFTDNRWIHAVVDYYPRVWKRPRWWEDEIVKWFRPT